MRVLGLHWAFLGLLAACGIEESRVDQSGVPGIGGKADHADQAVPIRFGDTVTGTVDASGGRAFFAIPLRSGDVVLTAVKPLGPGVSPRVHLVWDSYWMKEGADEVDPASQSFYDRFEFAREYSKQELPEGQRQFFVNHNRALYRFKTTYYVTVTNKSDQAAQFELTITCTEGPCVDDPDEKTITDYLEPNNTFAHAHSLWYPSPTGTAPILNLTSPSDHDWMYYPFEDESFEFDETDLAYQVSLEDPDTGELVPGLRLSVYYVCDRGEGTSTCRDGSEKDTAPDGTRGCKGHNRVTIAPECSSWLDDSGDLYIWVTADDPAAATFVEYRPVIRYLPFTPQV